MPLPTMIRFLILCLCVFAFPMVAQAQITDCPRKPAGKVNIVWGSDNIQYDFTKSQSQMDAMENDTVNPYGRHAKTHVGGLMKGGISVSSRVQVATMSYPRTRQVCQWIGNVDINILIDPKIYIARDHARGTCKHNAILEHEMKHVFVDREIVKKYIPRIQNFLDQAVRKVGIVGPKSTREAGRYQTKISDYIEDQLKIVTQQMYDERGREQQAIDTLEEYERVARMCR